MLEVRGVTTGYGRNVVLDNVSLDIGDGEAVTVLGANGAGKSTLMKAVVGVIPVWSGEIRFDGDVVSGRSPSETVRRGMVLCPEARHLFPQMSVRENLELGAYSRKLNRRRVSKEIDEVVSIFPRLEQKLGLYAGSMSGGEQQMLAIGRALMAKPKLLLLDEPSLGLAPLLVQTVMEEISKIQARGIGICLVEQNAVVALEVVGRGYVLENGSVAFTGTAEELSNDDRVKRAYLGLVDETVD